MSAGARRSWHDAISVAQEVHALLVPVSEPNRVKCVGSLRRRRETVGDIEFVIEPKKQGDLFGGEGTPLTEPVERLLRTMGTWVRGGMKAMSVDDVLGSGLRLEVYLVTPPAAWGSAVAIRTGPKELGKYVVTFCRENGYAHTGGRAIELATGKTVPTETEEEFFALAGVPCVKPAERDALAETLWRKAR